MKAALLAVMVLGVASVALVDFGKLNLKQFSWQQPRVHPAAASSSLSLPLYFEPNQGQADSRVKFLAHGAGYSLFLTANQAVLELQRRAGKGQSAKTPSTNDAVIGMRLEGASPDARVEATQPLPGKSNYFIGKDPSKWHRNIPQFGGVEYQNVYRGIDLVYYGKEQQLEYDFRVAPGADPNQIALSFQGAAAHLDSGDLVLTANGGDVRFHVPHVYQPPVKQQNGDIEQAEIQGEFRLLAGNKVGFSVGPYDHSRELVIDPILSYSTYFGSGVQQPVAVAIDSSSNIYLAGSTTATIPTMDPLSCCTTLNGPQDVFIAVLNQSTSQVLFATYLGGSGTDTAAGVAVDTAFNIYVAGTTNSADFPVTMSNAFQHTATFTGSQTHGFVSFLSFANGAYTLSYSTYLAGTTGSDTVTGVAIDQSFDAYVTGTTTSTDGPTNGFPSNSFAYQPCPFGPPVNNACLTSGPPQFFASKINTQGSGFASMLYSTYFGGDYPPASSAVVSGGGIAVDASGNLYFTGTTNMQGIPGPNLEPGFPIVNAYQSCLNLNFQSGTTNCQQEPITANTDAFLVKLNPSQSQPGAPPFFSTYLGGRGNDVGTAVAVDGASNSYVTGSTNSADTTDMPPDWNCVPPCIVGPTPPFGYNGGGGPNAFVAQVVNQSVANAIYPLDYFAYVGSTGGSVGHAIAVDPIGAVHVAGSTGPGLSTFNPLPTQDGQGSGGDAFAALVAPTMVIDGDFVTYLGGSGLDQGTGVALDNSNNTYVAGTTVSSDFPVNNGSTLTTPAPDAFVSKIGSSTDIAVTVATASPNPVNAGQQAAFTYTITNNGADPATNINFNAVVPTTFPVTPTAKIDVGVGTCAPLPPSQGSTGTIPCLIENLAAGAMATVEVDVTPPTPPPSSNTILVSCSFNANGGPFSTSCPGQFDPVVDFSISASPSTLTINNGETATFPILLSATNATLGYNGTITLSETTSPSIVTQTTPTFDPATVTLSGTGTGGSGMTTLTIATVARPVSSGSLFRRPSFYATWLPLGGLSLATLGIGAGRKRRRWILGVLLALLAGLLFLQPACSSNSNSVATNQGTAAGKYTVTVKGSASTNASHQILLTLFVN